MAKRRKITTPSADDLTRIEEEFRRETLNAPNPGMAPISQVSAESARAQQIISSDERVQLAHDTEDAQRYRVAEKQGRLIRALPIDAINPDVLVRDRTVIDPQEMAELKESIAAHGVRLPIEVFTGQGGDAEFALLSGYRRLKAVRELLDETRDDRYRTIPALHRDPEALGGGFAAMVEENEIRSSLSHYERGRIAVVATQRGAFSNPEDAVATLFKVASKAKRSKIRSFSLVFEELGDLLSFGERLKERDGLRLSTVLKEGGGPQLRQALEAAAPETWQAEWEVLAPVVATLERGATAKTTGRPKAAKNRIIAERRLSPDVNLCAEKDKQGYLIKLRGEGMDDVFLNRLLKEIQSAVSRWDN
ncbi:MAG: ParB/RepB/Spo0J family partition protein [Roseobacter sp.]